jgi:hypothetical protein
MRELWNISQHWEHHLDLEKRQPWIWMNERDFGGVAPPRVYKVPVKEKRIVAVGEADDSGSSLESISSSQEDFADEDTELDELCDLTLALAPEQLESEVTSEFESEPEDNGACGYASRLVLNVGIILRPSRV